MKELSSPPISQGRTAEIYVWNDHHVLKLFRDWCPPDWVGYEAGIARAGFEAGVPCPAPGEIIDVNGRRGLIYERLDGVSMLQDMNARPWTLFKHAHSLAELQVQINQQSITGLPTYKDRLNDDISSASQLSEDLREKAFSMLETLPEGQNVCHGDYHLGNVLITKQGPAVIDWMTACAGRPWADVARSSLILGMAAKSAGKQVRPIVRLVVRLYHYSYLNQYRHLMPDTDNELACWGTVIAAAWLGENIIPEYEALIRIVQEGVKEQHIPP